MRRIEPYRTVAGARRALDNGGRFFNLFTKAGDDVLSRAELARAAGVLGSDQAAFLYFALATSGLSDDEQATLLTHFDDDLRRRHRRHAPTTLEPGSFETSARAAKPFVVEGSTRSVDSRSDFTGFMMVPTMTGKVTTFTMVPIFDAFDLYAVQAQPRRDGTSCLVTVPHGTDMPTHARLGGLAKEILASPDKGSATRLVLETRYCVELPD